MRRLDIFGAQGYETLWLYDSTVTDSWEHPEVLARSARTSTETNVVLVLVRTAPRTSKSRATPGRSPEVISGFAQNELLMLMP